MVMTKKARKKKNTSDRTNLPRARSIVEVLGKAKVKVALAGVEAQDADQDDHDLPVVADLADPVQNLGVLKIRNSKLRLKKEN